MPKTKKNLHFILSSYFRYVVFTRFYVIWINLPLPPPPFDMNRFNYHFNKYVISSSEEDEEEESRTPSRPYPSPQVREEWSHTKRFHTRIFDP